MRRSARSLTHTSVLTLNPRDPIANKEITHMDKFTSKPATRNEIVESVAPSRYDDPDAHLYDLLGESLHKMQELEIARAVIELDLRIAKENIAAFLIKNSMTQFLRIDYNAIRREHARRNRKS